MSARMLFETFLICRVFISLAVLFFICYETSTAGLASEAFDTPLSIISTSEDLGRWFLIHAMKMAFSDTTVIRPVNKIAGSQSYYHNRYSIESY